MRDFVTYLIEEKNMAANTIEAYQRDVNSFARFVADRGIEKPEEAGNT